MICPKCGEKNADNFRFCGMCGAALEAGKPAAAPKAAAPTVGSPRSADVPVALRITANPPRGAAASERSPSISGPSMLGLGQLPQSGPTLESLREKSFSGVEPKFLYEDAQPGRGRTLLLMVILAVLGVGVWARYHYLGYGGESAKPRATVTPETPGAAPNEQTPPKQRAEAPSTTPAQPAVPPPVAAPTAQNDTAAKNLESTPKEQPAQPAVVKPATPPQQTAKLNARASLRDKSVKPVAVAKTTAAADSGDAAFRKGEAYLYGRGVAENCDEAVKNLKAASAKSNAKARSTFGTMYATGHCVPRDLPTSYSWFALALRADPSNQILEKDLTAIWNQMTPPERQLATKLKQ